MGTEIIQKQTRPNSISFRWGGTGTDIKLYFEDEQDLLEQLSKLNSNAVSIKNHISAFKMTMEVQ